MNDQVTETYDVIVIGGGTAGSNAARTAGSMGSKVLMIHRDDLQNLCIERGCMPSKSLLAASEVAYAARNLPQFSVAVDAESVTPDMPGIMARRDQQVARFLKALNEKVDHDPYQRIRGVAEFLPNESGLKVTTATGEKFVKAKRYVLATGTEVFVPPIPGIDTVPYLTSDDVMVGKLMTVPASIAVMGAGAIGLEFATFFAGLGSQVTLIDRGSLLKQADPEFGEELVKVFQSMGVTVLEQTAVTEVSQVEESIKLQVITRDEPREFASDYLFIATGRKPHTASLQLERIGVELAEKGIVSCDDGQCTTNPNVYVAGDVTADLQLLHIAEAEGKVAGYNASVGSPEKKVDREALDMSIIFTDPPFASVGLSEREIIEQGIPYVVATRSLAETGRAIVMGVQNGLWKMMAHKESGRILGSTILGPRGDDLIHQVHLARSLGADVRQLATIFAYHPTLSEQFTSLVKELATQIEHAS